MRPVLCLAVVALVLASGTAAAGPVEVSIHVDDDVRPPPQKPESPRASAGTGCTVATNGGVHCGSGS